MGHVYTDVTLKNATDVGFYMCGAIQEPDIRQTTVHVMVDTGAGTLIINDAIRQELGVDIIGEKNVIMADRRFKKCKFTEPVQIHWGNRFSTTEAVVMEGVDEILLGAIPLQLLDLIVDPANETLIGAHGDQVVVRV